MAPDVSTTCAVVPDVRPSRTPVTGTPKMSPRRGAASHQGCDTCVPTTRSVSTRALSVAMAWPGSTIVSATSPPFTRTRASVSGRLPRLYTLTVTGMVSPSATTSRGTFASTATPSASPMASSTLASRLASEVATSGDGERGVRRAVSPSSRSSAGRTLSGRARFTTRRASATAAITESILARSAPARSLVRRAQVVSSPSKIERSRSAGVPSFTRVASRRTEPGM